MRAFDFASDVRRIVALQSLGVPNEIGDVYVTAIGRHFRKRPNALLVYEREEVFWVSRVYVIDVLVALAANHQLDEIFVLGRKVLVDNVEQFVPIIVVLFILF